MAYDLTAVLKLKDDYSGKMKKIIAQTQMMKMATASTSIAVAGLGSAMSTTTAVGVAAVGALGASFAAAGAGAVAYGVVATSALTKVFDASEELGKIQEKIDQADTVKERIAAQKELAALYKGMSKAQRGALTDLQEFKSFWGGFTKQFENPIFQAFSEGLNAAQTVLTKLQPTILSVSGAVVKLMQGFNSALGSSGAAQFFEWLETNAARSLTNFAKVATNTFSGVVSLLQAFQPLGVSMETSLVSLTQKFKEWAASLSGTQGFKDFVAYVQANGPALWNTLTNIGNTLVNVGVALAPLGQAVVTVADNLAGFLEKVTSVKDVVIVATTAFIAYKASVVALTAIGAIVTLMRSYQAVAATMTVAQWALNTAMAANPIGLVAAAIAGLVAAGVLLYRNWDTIKAKAIQLWNSMGSLKAVLLAMTGPFGAIVAAGVKVYQNWDKIKAKAVSVFGAVGDWIDGVKAKFNGFVSAVKSFKMPSFKMPSIGSVKAGMGPSKKDKSSYHGESYVPRNGMMYRLHQGERVLTKKENRQFSKGTGGGVTINLNGTTIREDADVDKLASALARQIYLAGEAGA
ncbi:hypothetical protein COJ90_21840 [Priestia megaterium]|uniref:hypothetical protein n=1 Tax=Priestia megaterium TaxID=1404 RepID=UPI000BF85BB9|nr:hypothetical protein [Priestia megaterium]PFP08578.1 hypothetical protein COJ90_21840 [Priestia megaterium]